MDKKLKKAKDKKPVVKKKTYMPPRLTIFGKLIELTAGGSTGKNESTGQPFNSPKP